MLSSFSGFTEVTWLSEGAVVVVRNLSHYTAHAYCRNALLYIRRRLKEFFYATSGETTLTDHYSPKYDRACFFNTGKLSTYEARVIKQACLSKVIFKCFKTSLTVDIKNTQGRITENVNKLIMSTAFKFHSYAKCLIRLKVIHAQ